MLYLPDKIQKIRYNSQQRNNKHIKYLFKFQFKIQTYRRFENKLVSCLLLRQHVTERTTQMAIFDAAICVAHAIQFRGSCRPVSWFMPSHVDVLIYRNPLYPQIYDISGIYLYISMNILCVCYSFIEKSS